MSLFDTAPAATRAPVYVDGAKHAYGRMVMCHLVSVDIEALHAMADRIGVARRWFQDPRSPKVSRPHYDIAKSKRALALAAGAIEVDKYQMLAIANEANNRFFDALGVGEWVDPLAFLRGRTTGRPHPELDRVEAWLNAELAKL